jgi:hypothetical protein
MLVIHMERDEADLAQRILQSTQLLNGDKQALVDRAAMALIAALSSASVETKTLAYNPHKHFGHLEEHEQRDHGLTSATDAEAQDSIR